MINEQTAIDLERAVAASADPMLGPAGRIVVGFDGSVAADAALRWALARAVRQGAPLHLIAVADEDSGAMEWAFAEASVLAAAKLLSDATERLAESHPGLVVSTELGNGTVGASLASSAGPDDLVVIWSDKSGPAQGRIYGAQATALAAVASGPVAVIPTTDLRLRTGVVVAVAGTETDPDVARIGAREAVALRSPLLLVHALPLQSDAARRASADAVLAAALSTVEQECDGLEASSYLVHNSPSDAILDLSRGRALLVVGGRRRSDSTLGSTVRELIVTAKLPIVIVP